MTDKRGSSQMTVDQRIDRLEHRVRELQTAVVELIEHAGIAQQVAGAERTRLDVIRLEGAGEAPAARLIELYG